MDRFKIVLAAETGKSPTKLVDDSAYQQHRGGDFSWDATTTLPEDEFFEVPEAPSMEDIAT